MEIDDKSLRYFLYSKSTDTLYKEFKLLKNNGEYRVILAPNFRLKHIQRKLAYILNLVYEPKSCAYGFMRNKNIVDNAKQHVGRKLVLNIDLKDFFTQIHFGRVRGMFHSSPYNLPIEVSTTIAQLSCVRGILPQGAPSSPIITNMICRPLDNQLIKLAKKYGVRYSRYADDLTFSTYRKSFPSSIIEGELDSLKLGKELSDILTRNSFVVNENKIFLNSKEKRQEVTGLVVNSFPNIKREYIKELRAILYNSRKNGIYSAAIDYIIKKKQHINVNIVKKCKDEINEKSEAEIIAWFKEVLKGKINFIKQVRGDSNHIFLKYAKEFNDLFNENIFDVSILETLIDKVSKNVFILESNNSCTMNQGSCFVAKDYGIFTSYHVTADNDFYRIYKWDNPEQSMGTIKKDMNEEKSDKDIDYALHKNAIRDSDGFEIDAEKSIAIGDKVTIIGYPDYIRGDSPSIQTCEVISRKNNVYGSPLYVVSGRIINGTSGGPVLDDEGKVIGIVKAGIVSMDADVSNDNQGFVPINLVIEDIKKEESLCNS